MRSRTRLIALLIVVALPAVACTPGEAPVDAPTPTAVQAPVGTAQPDEDGDPVPTPNEESAPDLGAVSVTLTEVASVRSPTAGVHGPDGVLWVAERQGTVRVLSQDGALSDPVLDISGSTTTDSERGLLGLAFDEGHAHLYISYTDEAGDSRVDELQMDGNRPVTGSQRSVLRVEQPFGNHNGGDIAFGPDEMLYLGLGDGGGGGDPLEAGQDTSTLLGSLLRIDPGAGDPYGIPGDNPFADDVDGRDEIWAYGLRNPWRFSFDRATGDLWIADVGQSEREEINYMPAGQGAAANYGWNFMEGSEPFAGAEPEDHVPPTHEYETSSQRCAITGGHVYRGDAIPALQGAYLFSDYCGGAIYALAHRDGQVTDVVELGVDGGQVVSFASGADGETYVLDLGGAVLRIDPA